MMQSNCVEIFDRAVPAGTAFLYAVPNGGRRDGLTGAILKAEGVRAGVADLVLMLPRGRSVYIEMKVGGGQSISGVKVAKGYQSDTQQGFQATVEALGFRYVICRSEAEFEALLIEEGVPLRFRTHVAARSSAKPRSSSAEMS
ncbi:VRR-NUC domain-containing protein [Rhodovarius crocodyli]|uniref:VRR-NUC domain-containing protein n=1 Tax=Rhodovarius crocodyli TaxID=1979269 RepID=UPI001F0B9DA6|nr:VRR-NUC domain-containing protein [Rhodovarius crocodyli]